LGGPEPETIKKPSSNRSAKERRNTLFRVLDGVLSLSHKKIHNGGNSDRVKQGWARVLVSAVSTYGNLLKDEELELRHASKINIRQISGVLQCSGGC
jgi:hypothetical protein